MDRNRLVLIGGVLVMALVLVGGYFLGVAPQLQSASDAQSLQRQAQTTNANYSATLAALKRADARRSTLSGQLTALEASVPVNDSALPSFLSELQKAADAAGVSLDQTSVQNPLQYSPPVPTPSTPSSATTTAAASAAPSAPTLYSNSAITTANFAAIPVTVTVTGTYAQGLAFTKILQTNGGRLFLITSVGMSPGDTVTGDGTTNTAGANGASSGAASFRTTLGGDIYVLGTPSATTAGSTTSSTTGSTTGSTTSGSSAGSPAGD